MIDKRVKMVARAIARRVENIDPDTMVIRRPLPVTRAGGFQICLSDMTQPVWALYVEHAKAALDAIGRAPESEPVDPPHPWTIDL